MSEVDRQRIDLWLWRARLTKTRGGAARWVAEGGVRLIRNGVGRIVDKPSTGVGAGDVLVLPGLRGVQTVRVVALGMRRGPPPEARALYAEVEGDATFA